MENKDQQEQNREDILNNTKPSVLNDPFEWLYQKNKHPFFLGIVIGLVLNILVFCFACFSFYYSVSPHGNRELIFWGAISYGCIFLSIPTSLFIFFLLSIHTAISKIKIEKNVFIYRIFLSYCVISLLFFLFLNPFTYGREIRMKEIHKFTVRSQSLINAINDYKEKYGKYPAQLKDLVPVYFKEVPKTGIGSCPEYTYYNLDISNGPNEDKIYYSNPWILKIPTPLGFLNWDQMLYFPLKNYPKEGFGGWLEPIGDWAYVHE